MQPLHLQQVLLYAATRLITAASLKAQSSAHRSSGGVGCFHTRSDVSLIDVEMMDGEVLCSLKKRGRPIDINNHRSSSEFYSIVKYTPLLRMEARALKNPYPDYNGNPASTQSLFDSQGKLTPEFSQRIRGKVCQLLEVMEDGLKSANPRDCTSYTGWTGISLLYLHLHDVLGDATFLTKALDAVGRNLHSLTRRHDVTFLCGDAGPLAVAAAVFHRMQRPHEATDCLNRLLQLHPGVVAGTGDLPDELLYGRVGYLYALVFINQQLGQNRVPLQYIQQISEAVLASGENLSKKLRIQEQTPLMYAWYQEQYVGAAHGLAGIYYYLMQVSQTTRQLSGESKAVVILLQLRIALSNCVTTETPRALIVLCRAHCLHASTICVDGHSVTPSPLVRNLGIYMDPALSFKSHINHVTKTSFFHLRNIARLRPTLSCMVSPPLFFKNCNMFKTPLPDCSPTPPPENTSRPSCPGFVVGEERVHSLVRPSVDQVSRLHSPGGNYPASLGDEGHPLVHWCHGAPGVVYMLLQAYRVFGEGQYLSDAVRCGEVVWRWGLLKKGYGLCHGAAGNAYTFLALYRLTLDPKHLYRACMFADWCMRYGEHGCRTPDTPFSLFEGMAGTIYFLADLLQPMKSKFPAFEV
ncbi:LanC-like protein 1 [Merluccius polli]|uniref:Glutathione S-transferase LANCL1 n=1 Tax=Merluccius polli TaxID=89951 RepID=A0AA47MFS9_MERPO|nr:LanC-like protein 1 [Merluccius polli]